MTGSITALVEVLVAGGATPELILAAVRTAEATKDASIERGKEKARARFHKWKAANVSKRQLTFTTPLVRAHDARDLENKQTNKEGRKEERTAPAALSPFSDFWDLYPNKIGKRTAEREFGLALQRSSFEEIMDGLRRYVAKTDDRPWCNPSTFLHQDRWADQPAQVQRQSHGPPKAESIFDAYHALEKQGIFDDEQDFSAGHNDHAQRLPAERGGRQAGTVVDLRPGIVRRLGSGDH